MKSISKIWKSIFSFVYNEISGTAEETYLEIGAAPVSPSVKTKPFARADEVPDLGKDKLMLIQKAEKLFANDELRLRWLVAQSKLRKDGVEWIMEPKTSKQMKELMSASRFPKWGITHKEVAVKQ